MNVQSLKEDKHIRNWHKENLIDRHSLEKFVACAVSKKYKKLRENFPKNNFLIVHI